MKTRDLAVAIGCLLLLAGCASPTPVATQAAISETVVETQPPAAVTEAFSATQEATSLATEAVASPPSQPPASCELTPEDMEGPYYLAGAPIAEGNFISLVTPGMAGERLTITGTVYLAGCQTTLGGATLEMWQADSQGNYDLSGYTLRGGAKTDANGVYTIETIVPAFYEGRPQHIHYKVIAEGRPVFTSQIYFANDSRAAGYPAAMLVSPIEKDGALTAVFNIVLSP